MISVSTGQGGKKHVGLLHAFSPPGGRWRPVLVCLSSPWLQALTCNSRLVRGLETEEKRSEEAQKGGDSFLEPKTSCSSQAWNGRCFLGNMNTKWSLLQVSREVY